MLSVLPPSQHAEAVAALYVEARGFYCACGQTKRAGSVFCDRCAEILFRAGFSELLRTANYTAGHNTPFFQDRYWRWYDALVDVSAALRSGRWNGKRARKNEAE